LGGRSIYLETALVVLDEDDLGQLGKDNIESVSDVVDTAMKGLGI